MPDGLIAVRHFFVLRSPSQKFDGNWTVMDAKFHWPRITRISRIDVVGRVSRRGAVEASLLLLPSYQIRTRASGATYILSPGCILNASYQASMFRVGPITRNCRG